MSGMGSAVSFDAATIGQDMMESQPHVLLVDDDDDMSLLVAEVLAARGFVVSRSATADVALARVAEADAVVTDVNLARVSGLELCDRIASVRPALPVVLMSGDVTAKAAALRRGAHFLCKPIDVAKLALLLERLTQVRPADRSLAP
jgi:DNA-binding NtrC family response regulator